MGEIQSEAAFLILCIYSRLSKNDTVWNNRTGEKNSWKLINEQYEITAHRAKSVLLILLLQREHKAGYFREKNKQTVSNKSVQDLEKNKCTVRLLDSLEYIFRRELWNYHGNAYWMKPEEIHHENSCAQILILHTGYSFWDRLRNFYTNLHELFCQFISWTNWVNSGIL